MRDDRLALPSAGLMRAMCFSALCPLVWLMVVGMPPATARAQVTAATVAQERFSRGRDLFDAGEYEPALAEFRAACELSDSPNARLYVARSLVRLSRFAEAVTAFGVAERTARELGAESPRYLETAEAARLERESLEAELGRLVLRADGAPANLELELDEEALPVAALGLPLFVGVGEHRIAARAPGSAPRSYTVVLVAGEEREVLIALSRSATDPASRSSDAALPTAPDEEGLDGLAVGSGVLLGVGAVALGVSAPLWALSDERYGTLLAMCPGGSCPPSLQGVQREGVTFEGASVGLLIGGVSALVMGGVLLILDVAR